MGALYFVFGIMATLVVLGIIAGIQDYEDFKTRERRDHDKIQELITRLCWLEKEVHSSLIDISESEDNNEDLGF